MAEIQIRAKGKHLYFFYQYDDGTPYYFRGGPQGGNTAGLDQVLTGDIVVERGLYVKGTSDWEELEDTPHVKGTIWSGTDAEIQPLIDAMEQEAARIDMERYDYNLPVLEALLPDTPWGNLNNQNSNSVARQLAIVAGLETEVDNFIQSNMLDVPGYSSEIVHSTFDKTLESLAESIRLAKITFPIFLEGLGYKSQIQALSWGDPHLITLDGTQYDHQRPGEYLLLNSTNATMPVEIQSRQELYGASAGISVNTAISFRIDGNSTRLGFYLPPRDKQCSSDRNDFITASDTQLTAIYAGADISDRIAA